MGLLFNLLQTGRPHNLQLVSYEHLFRGMWSTRLVWSVIETYAPPLLHYLRRLCRLLFGPDPLHLFWLCLRFRIIPLSRHHPRLPTGHPKVEIFSQYHHRSGLRKSPRHRVFLHPRLNLLYRPQFQCPSFLHLPSKTSQGRLVGDNPPG